MRLRPYKKTDEKYLLKWFDDERKFYMWSAGIYKYPLDEKQLSKHRQTFEDDENGWIFMMLDEVGIPIGHVAIKNVDYKANSAHIGFIVVDPEQRGKGYGKKLVNLITKYAFDILNVDRVTLNVFEVNPVAKKCYEFVGFKVESRKKAMLKYNDEEWDAYFMIKNK